LLTIQTPTGTDVSVAGLMNPNHFLPWLLDTCSRAVHRWRQNCRNWKDRGEQQLIGQGVVKKLGRELREVPGFNGFGPPGRRSCCFGGEESAGASFFDVTAQCGRRQRRTIMDLPGTEITAASARIRESIT